MIPAHRSGLQRSLVLLVLPYLGLGSGHFEVRACQNPPTVEGTITANVIAHQVFAQPGDLVPITVTATNFGDVFQDPPSYADGRFVFVDWTIRGVQLANPDDSCQAADAVDLGRVEFEETLPALAVLDDAYSPFADEPTSLSWTAYLVVPEADGLDAIRVEVRAHDGWGGTGSTDVTCIRVSSSPLEGPTASFESPVIGGASGTVVPFEILVERNDYPTERPLRLVVERENPTDPVDLFPIEPAQLAGEGILIDGDSARIGMTCGLHFPCFVGMANRLHLRLMDGDGVVWESRVEQPDGSGEACVSEARLAHFELLEVDGGPPTGSLIPGRDNEIVVRGYLRNPTVGSRMEGGFLGFGLPEGVELVDYRFHHHDNPLDAVDPTPAELENRLAELLDRGDQVIVHVPWLEHRFVEVTSGPPIFLDLFEVDLRLRVSPEAIMAAGDALDLPGPIARGVLGGSLRQQENEGVSIPVQWPVFETPTLELPGRSRTPPPRLDLPRRGIGRR
ncbi:MAG: hypothetical protein AAF533_06580 [Acidobacteriota bacterium]